MIYSVDSLINKYLPVYTYNEYHKILLNVNSKKAFETTKNVDMSDLFISKILMKLRGLPVSDLSLMGFLKNMQFTYLEEIKFKEFLIGCWTNSKLMSGSDEKKFINDREDCETKTVWNFQFEEVSHDKTLISTETRILCLTMRSRFTFSLYWFLIKPFSGLIRKEILKLIKKNAEKQIVI